MTYQVDIDDITWCETRQGLDHLTELSHEPLSREHRRLLRGHTAEIRPIISDDLVVSLATQ